MIYTLDSASERAALKCRNFPQYAWTVYRIDGGEMTGCHVVRDSEDGAPEAPSVPVVRYSKPGRKLLVERLA